ncbi:MAG TPA: TonB-dependent receptor [Steroidobacter sp.]|uniref:TonB-dependent receptor n=1 Tax=Steroidobacter sp. TaxID=1978227 RepID=UPI002ED8FA03
MGEGSGEASSNQVAEIIVTAQKWAQSANTVGMPITVGTAEVMQTRGIDSVADLTRLVPGFTIQESNYNSTSFTLRGVGFFNSDLSTTPAVTVYVDEAPLPYAAMAKLAAFDVSRVEVLKGPQGTLYGQNATGGAVNYIVAKATDTLQTGVDTSYGSFNRTQLSAFVSGPIAERVRGRIVVQGRRGDPWQESISRPNDRLGRIRELQGRAVLEWLASESFTSTLSVTVTQDRSDSLAAQFVAPVTKFPDFVPPGLLTFPIVTNSRAADWTPVRLDTQAPFPYANDTTLYHGSWRNEYRISDAITATSLTSYAHLDTAYGQDSDGTPFHITEVVDESGRVEDFYQELRVSGRHEWGGWLLGVNYTQDDVDDEPHALFADNDVGRLFQALDPLAYGDQSLQKGHMDATTYAVFGRLEYQLSDRLMIEGGVRYNVDRRTYDNCGIAVSEHFARFWNLFRGGAQPATEVGDCFVLDPADELRPVDVVHRTLNENSTSWRAGINWNPRTDVLLYANVSRGFKAGAVPVLVASTVTQFTPVTQESLLAYETGVKASLFDRRAQLNASVFYYDYQDKQLRGTLLDPTFGQAEALVSIPRSHVVGAEMQLIAHPIDGLTFDLAATYVDAEIDEFMGFDAQAQFGDQSNTPFPFAPKWQANANADYRFPIDGAVTGFVGASLTYNSQTYAGVGAIDALRIDAFNLLDLRAGVELDKGRYRVWAWGKNVTDEYYWNNVFANGNAIARFVGQPATYGVSLSARF